MKPIKKWIKDALSRMNIGVINLQHNRSTMACAFQSIVERKHDIRTVMDIGASDGRWSAELMKYLPSARYHLIEAQACHEPGLKAFCATHANASYCLAAAGKEKGEVYFSASSAFGGQASYDNSEGKIAVPVVAIDAEVRKRALPAPYLLKLDTHGFEVPIIEGARNTLKKTEVVIMECYNFKFSEHSLVFDEMCTYMKTYGFRVIDLVDPMHRPHDHSFWQMDLVFVRADRVEFSYNFYK